MKNNTFKQTEIGEIPIEWEVLKVDEFADVVGGGTPSTKDPSNFGGEIPWLTPKDLSGYLNKRISKGERNITTKSLAGSGAKILPKNTVLLTSRAPVGYVAIADNPLTTNQGFKSLVPKKNIDSDFIYYLLVANVETLKNNASGSTFQELSGGVLKQIKFAIPTLSEQQQIASILSSVDAKIELNRRMNNTLEEIGEALFKRWFMDFEFPNENGEPYKSSGGEMVDSELGEIPKGWKIGNLSDEFEILMGQSPPGSTYNENGDGLPFYQGRTDFGERYPSRRIFCSAPTRIARKFDTLLSVRAPVGDINQANEECCIGRGVASIRKEDYPTYTYYKLLYLRNVFLAFDKEGTVFGSINKTDLAKIQINLPPISLVSIFENLLGVIDKQITINSTQIENLTHTRDSLLPRLMNGKIRVN